MRSDDAYLQGNAAWRPSDLPSPDSLNQDPYVGYVWGPTGPIMEFDSLGDCRTFLYDPQGSCLNTAGLNGAGDVDGVADFPMFYDAYGMPVWMYTVDPHRPWYNRWLQQPFQYKGQYGYYTDLHSGQCYCLNRYYNPFSGRWTSRDPIGLDGGVNVYAYCDGNPVMGADPTGLQQSIRDVGFHDWFFSTWGGQLLSGETWGNGLYVFGSGFLHVVSFGHYSNRTAEAMDGYDASVICSTISFEAAQWALGEGAVALGGRVLDALKAARAARCMTVYRSLDMAGNVQYVGITNNLLRRAAEHSGKFAIQAIKGLNRLTPSEARAVEQCLIENHGLIENGGTLLNKINSIARTNPRYAHALREGAKLLQGVHYPGF